MKKLLLTLMVAIATVGMGHAADLRVMSFNIRFDSPKDTADNAWTARRLPCSRMISTVNPDVIGMQEPRGAQYEDIISLLPDYEYLRIPLSEKVTEKNSGRIMVFFRKGKYKMKKWGYFWLTEHSDRPGVSFETTDRNNIRAAIWVRLRDISTGKEFVFLTTHLPYKRKPADETARTKCTKLVVEKLKAIAGEKVPVFVTGDMNACWELRSPRRTCLIPFYEWMNGAREMSPETDSRSSFNGWTPTEGREWPNNLDHIFYRNATPLKFVTHDEAAYGVTYVSDHYPIVCDFKLP
jgi:endonuclease/exonuclease/phosphatase family metal-dependent hydrolase